MHVINKLHCTKHLSLHQVQVFSNEYLFGLILVFTDMSSCTSWYSHLSSTQSVLDGMYTVTSSVGEQLPVHCDMSHDEGPWMLIMSSTDQ